MNEFAINWIKGADYAEITVPDEQEEELLDEILDSLDDEQVEEDD